MTLPLHTERLLIRKFEERDVPDIVQYTSDPGVMRYLQWQPYGEQGARNNLERQKGLDPGMEGEMVELAIELREEGKVIGSVGIEMTSHRQAQVAFLLNQAYWKRGYAVEAVRALISYGFSHLQLHRITANCDLENIPSWKLMERLGMRREAHFRKHVFRKGAWRDEFFYAILSEEWQNTSPAPEIAASLLSLQ